MGLSNREQCDFWSFNCRLDEIQAAMLRVQLRHLDAWTEARRNLALRYNGLLRPYVEVPDEGPGEHCVFQTYVVKAERRDALKRYLNENGVEALIHYATPIHLQPAAKSPGYSAADFPKLCAMSARIMSLAAIPDAHSRATGPRCRAYLPFTKKIDYRALQPCKLNTPISINSSPM